MADSRRRHDLDLERALRQLGPRYPYPPTPNLATAVRTRIVARPAMPLRPIVLWRDPRRLALVAAVLVVLAGAAALINPATRDAIAHFFHVRGVIVTRGPSPLPSLSPATPLDLGRLTTLEEAQRAVGFTIVLPPALGEPDAVYVATGPPGGEVALAYRPRRCGSRSDFPNAGAGGSGLRVPPPPAPDARRFCLPRLTAVCRDAATSTGPPILHSSFTGGGQDEGSTDSNRRRRTR